MTLSVLDGNVSTVAQKVETVSALPGVDKVSVREEWITIEMPALALRGNDSLEKYSRYLKQVSDVRGNVKHVLKNGEILRRVDIPCDGIEVERIVRAIDDVIRVVNGCKTTQLDVMPTHAESEIHRLSKHCEELAWQVTEDTQGRFAVARGTRIGTVDVHFDITDTESRLAVHLDQDLTSLSAEVENAVAAYLLRVADAVRLVTATVGNDGAIRLGVSLPRDPALAELRHGLGALLVAYELTAREVRALLEDDELTAVYAQFVTQDNLTDNGEE